MTEHNSFGVSDETKAEADRILNNDFTEAIEMQQVWRTVSQSRNSGIFIWDVVQVVGTPFDEKHFLMCSDGTWIMIYCYHFWTIESAGKHLHDVFDKYQTLEIISQEL